MGVSAAAPVAVAAVAGGGAGAESGGEEQTEFTINLDAVEDAGQRVKVIKVVREITGLGLKEAKDLVDGAPKPLKDGISKDEAEDFKKKLEEVGAKASIK